MRRDAPTHWPFTSCLACSIFNVSQLTAAHWVISKECYTCNHSSLASTCFGCTVVEFRGCQTRQGEGVGRGAGGRGLVALTVPVTECGVIGVTGVVSVFHREAAGPLQPAGFLCHPR